MYGFIQVPFSAKGTLGRVEPVQQLGRVADNPSLDGPMVNRIALLDRHLFEFPQTEAVGQVQRTQRRITERSKGLPLNTRSSAIDSSGRAPETPEKYLRHVPHE